MTITHVLSGFQQCEEDITDEMKEDFINWMLFSSPYSQCFLNPSARDVLKYKSWVLDVQQESNYLVSAAIATRLISEFPTRFFVWHKLFKLGFNPDKAYVLCHFLFMRGDGTYPVKVGGGGSHTPFESSVSKEVYKNFTSHNNPTTEDNQSYQDYSTYDNISGVWGKKYKGGFSSESFLNISPPIKNEAKSLDIFFKEKKEHIFDTDEALLHLVVVMNSMFQGGK